MSYEPQYNPLRQEPACENHRNQHKTGKRKPWRFKSEWLPDKRFITHRRINGVWEQVSYSLADALRRLEFSHLRDGPIHPFQKSKTRQDALKSWQSMIQKKQVPEKAKYWLENTESGEIVNLSHIT